MAGLINEIQHRVTRAGEPIGDVLRLVKLASAKLNLGEIETWVDRELNGYDKAADAPEYRRLSGQPRYWNDFHGWQPITGKAEIIEKLSCFPVLEPVAGIERLLQGSKANGFLIYPYPPQMLERFSKEFGFNVGQAGITFSSSSFASILDVVRSAVLDWAIKMDKAGVQGSGMEFTPSEATAAHRTAAATASTVIHIGNVGTLTGVIGSGNTTGAVTSNAINIDRVRDFVNNVRAQSGGLVAEGVSVKELQDVLGEVDGVVKAGEASAVRKALEKVGNVLKSGSGFLTAGAIAVLKELLL